MINSQIADSVRLAQFFTVQGAPNQTLAMLNAVMTETLGMSMHNAISAQQNSQMVSTAAITSACARLLSVGPTPSTPKPPPSPVAPILPLAPITPSPTSALPPLGPAPSTPSTPAPAKPTGGAPLTPADFGLPPTGGNTSPTS